MRAGWWWIDRWRKSTAYTDMSAEEQGVYRNLLDELWLRDGALPTNEKALKQISGDADAWPRVREVVLARFVKVDGVYRNETHDLIMAESQKRAERQKRYRDRRRNVTDNVTDDVTPNVGPSPSPSPSLSKDPSPSPKTPPKSPSRGTVLTREFEEEFWPNVPKRIGKGKALERWIKKRKGGASKEEILGGLQNFRLYEQRRLAKNPDATPLNPSTWLNQERWKDDPEPETPGKATPNTARVPAGHPCYAHRDGDKWRNNGTDHAIQRGWWWSQDEGCDPIKREKVI